jgi:predicted DNA-binding transcriptional regulator AlpA
MSAKLRAELLQFAGDLDALMTTRQVCLFFAGISKMTIFRWVRNPASGFPMPFKIGQKNYWIRRDIISFRDMQRARAPGVTCDSRAPKKTVSTKERSPRGPP